MGFENREARDLHRSQWYGMVCHCAFNGKLASGSRDKYVKVWDTTASELPGGVSVWGVQI